jgi:hypothetical protein
MGFSRPQLVVVSSLFRWESLDGWDFLGHNLLLFQASFFTMEFWLSRSLSHELFRMEFWLSRSLSHELFLFHDGILAIPEPFSRTFSGWNFGYHGAFLTNFFFFHDGILAIPEPFSRTFSFFTMEFWLSQSLSHELFFFFHDGAFELRDLGEDSFHIYIYLYHKEYLHRIRLVKNLAS